MGTKIEQISISDSLADVYRRGYISRAAAACKQCLKLANIDSDAIQMLINSGIYVEGSICEPAVAALIHTKLLSNSGLWNPTNKINDFFSFDLLNSGVGTIQSIEVMDNFIRSGQVSRGIVVAGDSEPLKGGSENYNYAEGAGALLLSKNEDINTGFLEFKTYTNKDYKSDYKSYSGFIENRLKLKIIEQPGFLENTVIFALDSIKLFLNKLNLSLTDIDLVISSQIPVGFIDRIREDLKLGNRIIGSSNGIKHTSGLLYGIHEAFKQKVFHSSEKILFLSAGAGITVSLGLYINPKY